MVPDDGLQTEYFRRNCPYAVIDITVRGSPVPWQSAALGISAIRTRVIRTCQNLDTYRGVLDDFHTPAEFCHDVHVRQRRHITMGPGVNGDIRLELLERPLEQRRVKQDIAADHEMGRRDLVRSQIVIEQVRSLKWVRFDIRAVH